MHILISMRRQSLSIRRSVWSFVSYYIIKIEVIYRSSSIFNEVLINDLNTFAGNYNILALDSSSLIRFFYLRASTMVRFIGETLGATIALMMQGNPTITTTKHLSQIFIVHTAPHQHAEIYQINFNLISNR